jgi:hypothetical protein
MVCGLHWRFINELSQLGTQDVEISNEQPHYEMWPGSDKVFLHTEYGVIVETLALETSRYRAGDHVAPATGYGYGVPPPCIIEQLHVSVISPSNPSA